MNEGARMERRFVRLEWNEGENRSLREGENRSLRVMFDENINFKLLGAISIPLIAPVTDITAAVMNSSRTICCGHTYNCSN